MIEVLILYELTKKTLTMYGLSKEIKNEFSVLTTPSYGTIKPALSRLTEKEFVRTTKTMSSGGRPSCLYSITSSGKDKLKELLLEKPLENPIQFLPSARVRVTCSAILNDNEKQELFKILKNKTDSILLDIKNTLIDKNIEFYHKMVFDNLACEYKNFSSLLEGLNHASNN